MATTKFSDAEFLALPEKHPDLRDRFASIVSAVENSEGNLKEADAAEERIIEEMRLLGRVAMQGWAERQVEVTEREIRQQPQMHRQGKKTPLAYETRRDRAPSYGAMESALRPLCPPPPDPRVTAPTILVGLRRPKIHVSLTKPPRRNTIASIRGKRTLGGRLQIGIPAGLRSEFLRVQIGPAARKDGTWDDAGPI